MRILPFPLLLVTLAAAAMAGLACNDHDAQPVRNENFGAPGDDGSNDIPPEKAADATPTPTALPLADSCPANELACNTAVEVGFLLRAGDTVALVGDAKGFPVQCDASSPEPAEACEGAVDGVADGFLFGGNHREVLSRDAFVAQLDGFMQSSESTSEFAVASIGCLRERDGAPLECSDLFVVAYRISIDTGPVVMAFRSDPTTGDAILFAVLFESAEGAVIRGGFASLGLPFTLGLDGDLWWMPWEGR